MNYICMYDVCIQVYMCMYKCLRINTVIYIHNTHVQYIYMYVGCMHSSVHVYAYMSMYKYRDIYIYIYI